MTGESVIEPNWIFPLEPLTGPPLNELRLFALIVIEDFLLWFGVPLITELLYAIDGADTAGTAGEIECLPLIGIIELDFPWLGCTGPKLPIATMGDCDEEPAATGGDETAFFAAEE